MQHPGGEKVTLSEVLRAKLTCPKCKGAIVAGPGYVASYDWTCYVCGCDIDVAAFPALYLPPRQGSAGEGLVIADDASCFYHPAKKAVIHCDHCGRFLCALCDVEFHEEHLCPQCLETGAKKGKIKKLQNQRVLYDNIALSLAILPMLIFYFTPITAPIALFVAIRYWKSPGSVLPRTKIRYVLAIIIASLQIAGWAIGFTALFLSFRGG